MCVDLQTRYICCETSEIVACDRNHPESQPFCEGVNLHIRLVDMIENLCLDCHNWVREAGGQEVLDGLYEDFRKLISKRKGMLDLDYAYAPSRPQSKDVTRFWRKFRAALIELDEKEDFSNRMRGIARGREPVLDGLAASLRKVNLTALATSRVPTVKKENLE